MTLIVLYVTETALGGSEPVAHGWVEATYWAGDRPYTGLWVDGFTFPAVIRAEIVNGYPVVPFNLLPTGEVCCVRWDFRSDRTGRIAPPSYREIPNVESVAYGALPIVNRDTFAPADPTPSLLQIIRDESSDRF